MFKPRICGDRLPAAASTVYDATTRSRCAVTSATRALTRSCCALSTSSVVRWPTRDLLAHAVERNLGGGDLRLGGVDLRLGRIELTPGLGYRRLHLVAR